jgi:hypothetical protein
MRSRCALVATFLIFPTLSVSVSFSTADSDSDLRVVVSYEQGRVGLERLERAPDARRRVSSEGHGWLFRTYGNDGTLLDERRLRDPRILHVEWLDEQTGELRGRPIRLDSLSFDVILPVSPEDAARLEIIDDSGAMLGTLDLTVPPVEPHGTDNSSDADGVDASCSAGWDTALVADAGDPANRLNITFLGDGYTAAELDSYALDVQNTIDYLLAREPYSEYREFINFWRVDVISNESGADEPDIGIERDTALDCGFNWGGTPRCLFCPSDPVNDSAACVPETDEVLVVVNTARYGGCGGAYAVYAGKNASATDIAFHEMGHSFAGLADEYGGSNAWPPFLEHPDKNCSRDDTDAMANQQDKWWYWLGDYDVSTFEGCGGSYDFGVYRPVLNCEMRSLDRVLCPVCREEHILDYHARVDPIDDSTPATDPSIRQLDRASFSITRVQPLTHDQQVAWLIGGVEQPGQSSDFFEVEGESVSLGPHPIRVVVTDTTADVRQDPLGLLESERSWTLTVTCDGSAAEYDTDGDGICEQGLGGRDCDDTLASVWALPGEVTGLDFSADGQTLSWNAPEEPGGSPGSIAFDTLRSEDPASFTAAVCIESDDGSDRSAIDPQLPPPGAVWGYLVRADNACPGEGSLGRTGGGEIRAGSSCP